MNIPVLIEGKRGCGYRKPGGLYLMADNLLRSCGRLPHELTVCPTCSHGIKPARGWTWVQAEDLLGEMDDCPGFQCSYVCPLRDPSVLGRAGLIWIGETYYPSPLHFIREGIEKGISRRITTVPRDFEVGETWVLLAHRKAVRTWETVEKPVVEVSVVEDLTKEMDEILERNGIEASPWIETRPTGEVTTVKEQVFRPGIFGVFRPDRIEYVVKEDDSEEDLERLIARGITPVKVIRDIDAQGELFDEGGMQWATR